MSLTKPGAVTSARHPAPPPSSLASRTPTSPPASTRAFAATSPLGPAPITTASAVCPAMGTPRDRHVLAWSCRRGPFPQCPLPPAERPRAARPARPPRQVAHAPGAPEGLLKGPGCPQRPGAMDHGGPMTLADLLPTQPEPDAIYDAFTGWVEGRGIELYPAQQEAL